MTGARGTHPGQRNGYPAGVTASPAPAVRPASGWLAVLPRAMGWPQFTALVLAVLGLADSAYQAYTKLSGTGLAGCSARTDACSLVQNSHQAYIFGIPMAVFGLVFYLFMTGICAPPAWRSPGPLMHRARLAAAVVGMIFVLYLMYVELVELRQVCPYCTSVHIITFLLFCVIVFQASAPGALRGAQRRPGG
jgi:uncharacterized membrane protein